MATAAKAKKTNKRKVVKKPLKAPKEVLFDAHIDDPVKREERQKCNWNPTAAVDLKAAKWATDFLKRRTKEDPWFNGLTVLLHSGQVDYTKHQLVLERILAHGPKKVRDDKEWFRDKACSNYFDPFKGKAVPPLVQPLQFIEKSGPLAERFIKECGEDGKKCKGQKGVERFLKKLISPSSLTQQLKAHGYGSTPVYINEGTIGCPGGKPSGKGPAGFGPKIRELAREYAGNPNGVAVDRHIGAWVCGNFMDDPEIRDRCKQGFPALKYQSIIDTFPGTPAAEKAAQDLKDMGSDKTSITSFSMETDPTYRTLKGKVAVEAAKCKVSPAVMQVGAWFKQACREKDPSKGLFGGESDHDYVWLGSSKKLDKDDDVLCDASMSMVKACNSPKMYGAAPIGFCSEEKKKSYCSVFLKRVEENEKKSPQQVSGLSGKRGKKQVCSLAARNAFVSMLDRAI